MYFSDNEESEEDRGFTTFHPTRDNVREEINIARFYRSLCSNSMFGQDLESKSVQTEHDTSELPVSWIITGQKLVDDLCTELSNAMNHLHQPTVFKQKIEKIPLLIDVPKMKYFKYECGNWRSTVDPRIKFTAESETYHEMKIINAENFRKSFETLMHIATNLKDLVSYLDHNKNQPTGHTSFRNQTILKEDKYQQTEIENVIPQCYSNYQEKQTSDETFFSFTDLSGIPSKIDYISSSDENSSTEGRNNTDRNSLKGNIKAVTSSKIIPNDESSQVPGIKVLSYKLQPKIRICISENAERLNPVRNGSIARCKTANLDQDGLFPKFLSEKRRKLALSEAKHGKKCSKVGSQANQPHISKLQVPSAGNDAIRSDRFNCKFVDILANQNIPHLERSIRSCRNNDVSCRRSKIPIPVNACKNFIRKNILTSKVPRYQRGYSHVKYEVQNAFSPDFNLPFTHIIAGRISSPQIKHRTVRT